MTKSKIIAISHEKGGTAKTTTTVSLGIGLARQGKRVLLVDADPQGDLTKCLGISDPTALSNTLATALNNTIAEVEFDPRSVILRHVEGVDFIPANAQLAATEVTLTTMPHDREYVMQEFLAKVKGEYDYVLIDCRPSLGLTVVNALTAANSVIIPVQAHTLAAEDMDGLFKTVGRIKQRANPALKIDGIVMTMVDHRTNLARSTIRQVREKYGSVVRVFGAEIPYAVRAAEVPSKGKSIFAYDPGGKVSQAYERLTKEVISLGERSKTRKNSDAR
ncbi:MAG: ParA family protein [Oscillospiraceae bacterium]|nr:ParA family protein [Oscillospiraceae bacterium]